MDALELLTRDHRDGEILFDHYQAAATFDERRNLVYEVTGHLSQHTVVEERMLYPLLARVISVPSASMPLPRHDVHDGMHNVLMELAQTMRYDRSAAADLMATLHRDFTFHRNFDERHLHPLLRHALDQQARDELGQLVSRDSVLFT